MHKKNNNNNYHCHSCSSLTCTLFLCLTGCLGFCCQQHTRQHAVWVLCDLSDKKHKVFLASSLVCSTARPDLPSAKQADLLDDRPTARLPEKLWWTDLRSGLEGGIHIWESKRAVKRTAGAVDAGGKRGEGEKESEGGQRLKMQSSVRRGFILKMDSVSQTCRDKS